MSRQSFDNPFEHHRLNDSHDYRLDWDVPTVNRPVSGWLLEQIRGLANQVGVAPQRSIAVLLGPPGYGKTHLFGRVAHALGSQALFVFVPQLLEEQLERPLHPIRWHVVESLFEAPAPGQPTRIAQILARLTQSSFDAYMETLPDSLKARHQPLRQRLGEDARTVLEIVSPVGELQPYQRLADSIARAFPALREDIVRAIVLGWSPAATDVRRWLRGEDLADSQRTVLHLPEEPPPPAQVVESVAILLQRATVPVVISCDQLDVVLKDMMKGPMQLSADLVGLLHVVPNLQIILSCFTDKWPEFLKHTHKAFPDRVRVFNLDPLSADQSVELVRRRLRGWPEAKPAPNDTWPLAIDSIVALAQLGPHPRGLLQTCSGAFEHWLNSGATDWVRLGESKVGDRDDLSFFLRSWNEELQAVQQAARSPDDVQEEEIFQGVYEALQIAKQGKLVASGVGIDRMEKKAVKPVPTDPRPSLSLRLGVGKKAFDVVVAVTKKDGGKAFGAYLNALEKALGGNVLGAVLVRPHEELSVGPKAKARLQYDQAVAKGKLRPFPLDSETATFESLMCLLRLLQKAAAGEMQLGGKSLTPAEVQEFVVQSRVLVGLRLFEFIFSGWPALESARHPVAAVSSESEPVAAGLSAEGTSKAGRPKGPAGSGVTGRALSSGGDAEGLGSSPREPKARSEFSTADWAQALLDQLVDKLRKWGQPVTPKGFEIGPTFARLKVAPSDQTDITKVRNKAENLRIQLSLESRPLIDAQPGYISIDIQRPDRQTLWLGEVLKTRPPELARRPAFPAGVDVAGHTYWLDLTDPSNCHVLIAGITGGGKSEFMKVLLAGLAHGLGPDLLQLVLIDPKRVTFNFSGDSPYLPQGVARDGAEALPLIEQCFQEMKRRYRILEGRRLQNIDDLQGPDAVPHVVLVFDEFADVMLDKAGKKELEALLNTTAPWQVIFYDRGEFGTRRVWDC